MKIRLRYEDGETKIESMETLKRIENPLNELSQEDRNYVEDIREIYDMHMRYRSKHFPETSLGELEIKLGIKKT